MRTLTTAMIMTGCLSFIGCSYLAQQPDAYIKQSTVCVDKGWYGYHRGSRCPHTVKAVTPDASQEMAARLAALERQGQLLADELDAAKKQNGSLNSRIIDLERQLAIAIER